MSTEQSTANKALRSTFAFFLALVLAMGLLPYSAYADPASENATADTTTETDASATESAPNDSGAASPSASTSANEGSSSATPTEDETNTDVAAQAEDDASAALTGTRTVADGIYYINSALAAGKVLDVTSGSTDNGARIQLYSGNQSEAQKWRFTYDDSTGYYTIASVRSGKVLDASGGKADNGTAVQQWTSTGVAAQRWIVAENADGTISIHSSIDTTKVLDLTGGKSASGTKVQLYSANGTAAQKFTVSSAVHERTVADGTYYVANRNATGKVLDIASGSTANGARVQSYSSNMTAAQAFAFSYDAATGYYTITNKNSGKVLDAAGGKNSNGTAVQQYSANGTSAQRWVITKNPDGTVTIGSALSPSQVLDVTSGSTANGAKIQLYASNGTAAQHWTFVSTEVPEVTAGTDLGLGDSWFTISPSASASNALDITSGSTSEGAKAQIYTTNGTTAQLFKLEYDNGFYRLVCGTGKVLAVDNGSIIPGVPVVQTAQANDDNQLFKAVKNADGTYSFVCRASGTAIDAGTAAKGATVTGGTYTAGSASQSFNLKKCTNLLPEGVCTVNSALSSSKVLDVASGSMKAGANVQLYSSNNSFAQKWKISLVSGKENTYTFENTVSGMYLNADGSNVCQKADTSEYSQWTVSAIRNGAYELKNVATGKVLDVAGGKTANGTNIQVYSANGSDAQLFKAASTDDMKADTYIIRSRSVDSQVIDVAGGSTANGANIQSYKSNDSGAQKWKAISNGDGTYRIQNCASGKVIDVANGNAAAGTNIQQYTWNNTAAQKWVIKYVGNAGFRIISAKNSNVCLDFASTPANGVNVQLATVGATNTQLFRFETTTYTPPMSADRQAMYNRIINNSSGTQWLIAVNRGTHKVGVFKGSAGNWSLQYYWSCVTGAPSTPTITGTFRTTGYKRAVLSTDSRARYCTQIWGGYYFHTILNSDAELGKSLSHGCIRMSYSTAQWIQSNINGGTTVVIYN